MINITQKDLEYMHFYEGIFNMETVMTFANLSKIIGSEFKTKLKNYLVYI